MDARGGVEQYAYDLNGNLVQVTDRRGQMTRFEYDALNRRTRAIYPDSQSDYTYDAAGRLSRSDDSVSGTITFVYDSLDRLIQEEYIDYHEDELLDPEQFNVGLMQHLLWHNTERPHGSLKMNPPVQFIQDNFSHPECNMYVADTVR